VRRLGLSLALLGCAATVDGSRGDASATPPGDCAWRALPAVEVSPPGEARHRLVDAVETADGAWVAWRARRPGRDDDELYVTRVTDDGAAHPDTPLGSVARSALLGLPGGESLTLSMLAEGSRLTLLADGPTDRGGCVWTQTVGGNARATRPVDLTAFGAPFALGGCRELLPAEGGFSFVIEQIRATWGTEVMRLDADGRWLGRDELAMTARPTQSGVTRIDLGGGDFFGSWVEAGTAANPAGLYVRRFGARGEARGEAQRLASSTETLKDAVLTRTPSGALALWEGSADSFPASSTLLVRAIGPDAAPRGDANAITALGFVLGGLSASTRGEQALATAIHANDGVRLSFLMLSASGAVQVRLDTGLRDVDGPLRVARVTPTRQGALVFTTVAQGDRGGRVVAVPIRCQ
jgi:hypothetical protein